MGTTTSSSLQSTAASLVGDALAQPASYGADDCGEVAPQAVVALHQHDGAQLALGRNAEGIPCALHDERRHADRVEFGKAARLGSARRGQRVREAENAGRSGDGGGPAGDAGAGRAAADEQREIVQLDRAQVRDDRGPGGVELVRGCRRAPACDAVGLLDEGDRDALGECRVSRRDEVARDDPSPGPVPEHERRARVGDRRHLSARRAVRCLDLYHAHGSSAYSAATRFGTTMDQASRTSSRISSASIVARRTTAQLNRRSESFGIRNFSGSDSTSASRHSFGNANPSSDSSREKARYTMPPTRNFTRPYTSTS